MGLIGRRWMRIDALFALGSLGFCISLRELDKFIVRVAGFVLQHCICCGNEYGYVQWTDVFFLLL